MIDYNVTFEYLHGLNRMCESLQKENCTGCHFFEEGKCAYENHRRINPRECIRTVREWCNEHPEQTLLSIFNSRYPLATKSENGIPYICVATLGKGKYCNKTFDAKSQKCKRCWNTAVE